MEAELEKSEQPPRSRRARAAKERDQLAEQWRALTRAATLVALLTAPAFFVVLYQRNGWSAPAAVLVALLAVIVFRGFVDVVARRLIPSPSLYGAEQRVAEEDVVARRRVWYWRTKFRRLAWLAGVLVLAILITFIVQAASGEPLSLSAALHSLGNWFAVLGPQLLILGLQLPFLFLVNLLIFFGPLLFFGVQQIKGYEPGDADWGVRLQDVRGQAEAKEDVARVIALWQSGEQFERAGGKRERGLLFLGAPGTGKTMLAKAIATNFNSPFVTIPGSGFAQTFIGMDVILVRYLARKAKKLAKKWGGQCIVFIDEIDAVGTRRRQLEPGMGGMSEGRPVPEDALFFGPHGALTPSGDLILETRAWRDRLFAMREPARPGAYPPFARKLGGIVNQVFPGMFGGGGMLALNQLLVVMDGIDDPPFSKRFFTNRINTFLDALYFVPRRLGSISLRLPRPRPTREQIFFIGATNVPISVLDPALTRPGRMGRHVWFRTPTKDDRKDIFELYLGKVAHDPDLDSPRRRDELARITNGYAQPLDAKVLTPLGWKRMGDLQVGDAVIGGDGKATTVVGVHPRGEMDVYRVAMNDGTATECTADHLWSVDALDPRMLRRTFTLNDLIERGLRWSAKGSRFYLPKLPAVEFVANDELPVNPYLLGFMLGDGGLASTTPDVCSDDEESVARVAELLPAGVALVQHGPRNWWISAGRRGGRPNPLTESLRTLGLWSRTSHMKFIPDEYKLSSVEDRLSLLQGLLDTDGSVDYRRGTGTEFYTASRRLADDVAEVVRSLGGLARVKPKRDGWRVAIELAEEHVPFRLTRKAQVHRISRRPFRRRITAVEPVGRREVQCITVANGDGLYVTDDYIVTHNSPAMIEQVCSMGLTYAHSDGRDYFGWEDIVEAMTTVESGTAVRIEYVPEETRAVAIHEAGHAAAGHVYMKGVLSTRLSIVKRGESLGHHQAIETEERFSAWRHEQFSRLVWTLGAMAAERVFYEENSTGVGGDVHAATTLAALMVGAWGMGPEPVHLNRRPRTLEAREEEEDRLLKRFERIGTQIMNRTGAVGAFGHDVVAAVLSDPDKRRTVGRLLGQAYITAHHVIEYNREEVERIADVLVERKEMHGDEVVELLDGVGLKAPKIDYDDERVWPRV